MSLVVVLVDDQARVEKPSFGIDDKVELPISEGAASTSLNDLAR